MKMRQQYAEPLHDGAPPANTGAVGLFYFSGHGLGVNHKNLLVPSDFNVDVNATDRGAVEKKVNTLSHRRKPHPQRTFLSCHTNVLPDLCHCRSWTVASA